MAKKSSAQIRRLQQRAAARGEEYVYDATKHAASNAPTENETQRSSPLKTSVTTTTDNTSTNEEKPSKDTIAKDAETGKDMNMNLKKKEAAQKLVKVLDELSKNESMNAKERRSAKRKAEAIAAEEIGCPASDLLALIADNETNSNRKKSEKTKVEKTGKEASISVSESESNKKIHGPYVLFIGQISFTTTKEGLFQHFQNELGKDLVTPQTLQVRLLTDPKNNHKSRGMAFIETDTPELLYECLRLHHTQLDGRRINVERSAGGGKSSINRKEKINQYRKEQNQYISDTVDAIIKDFIEKKQLEEGELDDGVLQLCKRHSAATVEAALAQYVEARGKHMDNPSAYLTHIIGRVSLEGVHTFEDDTKKGDHKRKFHSDGNNSDKKKKRIESSRGGGGRGGGRGNRGGRGHDRNSNNYSQFSMDEVDMSISKSSSGGGKEINTLHKVFPSMTRGRGRGRGYMHMR